MYNINIIGINPMIYEISADNHEFIPEPSFKMDIDIPKNVVTVWIITNEAISK